MKKLLVIAAIVAALIVPGAVSAVSWPTEHRCLGGQPWYSGSTVPCWSVPGRHYF